MGFNNKKRSNDIWLMASQKGDAKYRSAVQQLGFKIPLPNQKGEPQKISFPIIANYQRTIKSFPLNAKSDVGLPVSYYIKEGPAEIEDNVLSFTPVPPRSKFPVKVTVVAWQYGYDTRDKKIQSADPVERTFWITN